ncbi:hypothetical protein MPL3356_350069 [Mesorhizobium plurifarium]|uniref:Uncharacterized protein n=1 Tax=Mesorhizobium plurifarium TaxID=69974 RepID=A0A090DWE5_MESPL|nr:hypothetical protein MPL3356_350069 [Mesorhizobium plurifarium]
MVYYLSFFLFIGSLAKNFFSIIEEGSVTVYSSLGVLLSLCGAIYSVYILRSRIRNFQGHEQNPR